MSTMSITTLVYIYTTTTIISLNSTSTTTASTTVQCFCVCVLCLSVYVPCRYYPIHSRCIYTYTYKGLAPLHKAIPFNCLLMVYQILLIGVRVFLEGTFVICLAY